MAGKEGGRGGAGGRRRRRRRRAELRRGGARGGSGRELSVRRTGGWRCLGLRCWCRRLPWTCDLARGEAVEDSGGPSSSHVASDLVRALETARPACTALLLRIVRVRIPFSSRRASLILCAPSDLRVRPPWLPAQAVRIVHTAPVDSEDLSPDFSSSRSDRHRED